MVPTTPADPKACSDRVREEVFNTILGDVLKDTTIAWRTDPDRVRVERKRILAENPSLAPDILVNDPDMPPIVIESSVSAADAEADARKRLGNTLRKGGDVLEVAVGVVIPDDLLYCGRDEIRNIVPSCSLRYVLLVLDCDNIRRFPASGMVEGTVADLADTIHSVAVSTERVKKVSAKVVRLVLQASSKLDNIPQMAREHLHGLSKQRSWLSVSRTIMVLWLNALLAQDRLYGQNAKIPPPNLADKHPDPMERINAWREIIETNWWSVFNPAVESLESVANHAYAESGESLGLLVEAVRLITKEKLGTHINVGAELFPKLSEDRKQAAAFYTNSTTADMLAHLTIRQQDLESDEWADPKLLNKHRMADMACGTGTLLRAGYRRIKRLYESNGGPEDGLGNLHHEAMERGLVGIDVFHIASHLTASGLSVMGDGRPHGMMSVGYLEVGGPRNSCGSLEYMDKGGVSSLVGKGFGAESGGGGDGFISVVTKDGTLDWVLMNPPFSRTRGGQSAFDIAGLDETERKGCQRHWKELVAGEPASLRAGMAASFVVLAGKKLKPGGRMGFVLPISAAFMDTWAVTRRYLARNFTDLVAITVGGGWQKGMMSDDTNMNEMLLVGTKRVDGEPEPVKCVTLAEMPARAGEAVEVGRAILNAAKVVGDAGYSRPVIVGDREFGQLSVFDAGDDGVPWNPLGAERGDLAVAANELVGGTLKTQNHSVKLPVEMSTIGEVFGVGPTHDLIGSPRGGDGRGAFEMHPVSSKTDAIGSDRSLWAADAKSQTRLVAGPTHKGVVVGSEENVAKIREGIGRLFYARGLRWTSQALVAAMTQRPAMGGSAWTALLHDDIRVLKAATLWFNSTLGMMVHWTQGSRTQPGRARLQVGAIRKVPCPRFGVLDDTTLDVVAADFDRLAALDMKPACQAHADEVRRQIDEAVLRMFGLGGKLIEDIDDMRLLLCSEPTVHGHNKTALQLLVEKGD